MICSTTTYPHTSLPLVSSSIPLLHTYSTHSGGDSFLYVPQRHTNHTLASKIPSWLPPLLMSPHPRLLPRSLHRWHTLEMSSLDYHILNGTHLTPFPTFLFNYSPWYLLPSTWHIYLLVHFPTLECKFTQERHSSIYLCICSTRTLPGTLQKLGKYCCMNEWIKNKMVRSNCTLNCSLREKLMSYLFLPPDSPLRSAPHLTNWV